MHQHNPANQAVRILVAIASFGEKNRKYLETIVSRYSSMSFHADIVVFTDKPKGFPAEVQEVVGLPANNPWTLPFAHKNLFAREINQYDLFVYSEDDIYVEECNIEAFLKISEVLLDDEIAGFLRYERDSDGEIKLTDMHGGFHWDPASARKRGEHTIAEFTNDHAGFYILTQTQLKWAVASGGFIQGPRASRYGLPETAATDPYTCCGLRKVVCISEIRSFLIYHMSDLYVNRHGLPWDTVDFQIKTLIRIAEHNHPAKTLCRVESRLDFLKWSKRYDEKADMDLLALVPDAASSILSIGCGSGETETVLRTRGAAVVVAPLDSVVGADVEARGFEVVHGTMDECMTKLSGRRFDCVVVSNLLHLQRIPEHFIEQCFRCVRSGGTLVASGPNFTRFPLVIKCLLGSEGLRKLKHHESSGISLCGPEVLKKCRKGRRPDLVKVRWVDFPCFFKARVWSAVGGWLAKGWVASVTRD